jgi:hypothetical protein
MASYGSAWRKIRWSLAQRGLLGTIQTTLERARRIGAKSPPSTAPAIHPFDHRYGVDTSGLIGGGDLATGHRHDIFISAYYGMAPSRFYGAIDRWTTETHRPATTGQYSFVDLGCGKGRAVMMASEMTFRQAVGVELNAGLAAIANKNIAIWKAAGRENCPVQIICGDATEFVFPDGPCLLYLFNPFSAPVVARLILQIEALFKDRPGLLDIIYFNPVAAPLFDAHPGFELLWTGMIPMSEEDTLVDLVASPDDVCSLYRWVGN